MATECKKKRNKKDPILAAARTAANKRRNIATQARRQEVKRKKTYRWALRNAKFVGSHLTCHEMRKAARRCAA